jgi:hypothetical protein
VRSYRILAGAALGLAGACVRSEAAPPGERPVLELPAGIDDVWATVSPGGRGAAYTERRGSDAFLQVGGRRLGPYP